MVNLMHTHTRGLLRGRVLTDEDDVERLQYSGLNNKPHTYDELVLMFHWEMFSEQSCKLVKIRMSVTWFDILTSC